MPEKYERIDYNNEMFRKNLDFLTSTRNITKSKIEEEFALGKGALSRYCREDEKTPRPSIEIVNSLAKLFNVSIDDLINNDIEKKQKELNRNEQRKELLLCKDLIERTKDNKLNWRWGIFDGSEEADYCNDIIAVNPYEGEVTFHSKFILSSFPIEEARIQVAYIDENIKVLLAQLPYDKAENNLNYEMYFIQDEETAIKVCSGYVESFFAEAEIDKEVLNILTELFGAVRDYILFGKERHMRDKIINRFLRISK